MSAVAGDRYRPVGDYALLSDCHSVALVSRQGSVDRCCMPRVDSASVFGRLLDADRGGFCAVLVDEEVPVSRRYLEDSLVLETTFRGPSGEARLLDCFTMRRGGARQPYRQLLRVVEGVRGWLPFRFHAAIRFDYGEVEPWVKRRGIGVYSAIGGNDGLLVTSDVDLERAGQHDIAASVAIRAGQRLHFSLEYRPAEEVGRAGGHGPDPAELDARLEETLAWWRRWASQIQLAQPGRAGGPAVGHGPQGPPERPHRADRGRPDDQPAREPRRRPQLGLPLQLGAGFGVHRPVPRAGPDRQRRRHAGPARRLRRAARPRLALAPAGPLARRRLLAVPARAGGRGRRALAGAGPGAVGAARPAPPLRPLQADRGVFVQAFGSRALDAALLLLPSVDFLPYDDPRMLRTADAIRTELDDGHGLIRRYRNDDHLADQEGAFVTCSFWLAECLAHQGRMQEARELFDRVSSCGSDLGLFPEEYDGDRRELLGNFPQGLSHLSHIAAVIALAQPYGPGSAVAQHAFGAGQHEEQIDDQP